MTFADEHQRGSAEPRPAGPVGAGNPPPPPVAKASSGEGPPSPPPAGGGGQEHDEPRPAGPGASDTPGAAVEADLATLLAEAESKRDEYLELARRTQADFENFRKRMTAEVGAAARRGRVAAVGELVPAIDDLERAIVAAGLDPEGDSEDGLAHGVLLVFRNLREALGRCGVEAVDPAGEAFDPNLHEAISTQPVEGAASGQVVEVMQKGYRLEEQLIRPARVVVAQ